MTYFVIDNDDCKYEGMTKEQILSAIEQGLEQGYVSDPASAVFSKIKEIRASKTAQLWIGTEAQFNALSPAPSIGKSVVRVGADGVLYLCSDDSTFSDMANHIADKDNPHSVTASQVGAALADHGHSLDGESVTGVLPLSKGGHNGTTAAEARANLGITPANIGAVSKTEFSALTPAQIGAASQADFDALKVGGRNLITSDDISVKDLTLTGRTFITCPEYQGNSAWSGLRINLHSIITRNDLRAGDELSFSIYHATNNTSNYQLCVFVPGASTKYINATPDYYWHQIGVDITLTDDIIAAATDTQPLRIEPSAAADTGKYYYWVAPKLERGNRVTDWTPAPEDINVGLEIQSGVRSVSTSGTTVTFAKAFSKAPNVVITAMSEYTTAAIVTNITTTGFTISGATGTGNVQWIAVYAPVASDSGV